MLLKAITLNLAAIVCRSGMKIIRSAKQQLMIMRSLYEPHISVLLMLFTLASVGCKQSKLPTQYSKKSDSAVISESEVDYLPPPIEESQIGIDFDLNEIQSRVKYP